MEALWNQLKLHRPPYRSWDISLKEYDSREFISTIDNILADLKTFDILHIEAALLSRLIYRMKSKFRSDKGFKNMEKVNRALLNYLNMSLEREFESLKDFIEINNGIISLPPKQSLEYVLVRMQGFAKLMCRVESSAIEAATILKTRLHTGQSWPVALLAYGIISRIWVLSRHITRKACAWYSNIHAFTETFESVGIPWLPENYHLPTNLSSWLNVPWINETLENIPIRTNWEKSIFDFIETNSNDEIKIQSMEEKTLQTVQKEKSVYEEDFDLGKPVARNTFQETLQAQSKEAKAGVEKCRQPKKKTKRDILEVFDIKSEKDLVKVLVAESHPTLDKLQWSVIVKRLRKLIMKLTENNTRDLSDKSFKKINRCLKKWTNLDNSE
ncbi:hypothetical protein QAD02_000637 [Eretmocerus hayati]|uniref:Uncharacterized protein n=1 Tax=Eretmocerus hayati TaxID=131215 RepID=A0ACC2NF20_9HYME|nr:hypothetical protein QAD02_000637 [Eretmocerus hayati]